MHLATQGLWEDFQPVEKALREELILGIFHRAMDNMPDHKIKGFTVKHVGLEILETTQTAKGNWTV